MPSRTNVGILGGKGMLGSDLVKFLGEEYSAQAIDKDNYENWRGKEFDIFINANGNSRRFWANNNPTEDFDASTASVYKSTLDFKFEKYIYISSSDVYPDHTNPQTTGESIAINSASLSPYGFHKYLSEQIVKNRTKNNLILRSSLILGNGLKKGPFYDILSGNNLFITLGSRLQIITTRTIAEIIKKLVNGGYRGEIFNMGGRGTFSFKKAEEYFKKPVKTSPEAELQEYEMNVTKLRAVYPLKTSEEYFEEFLKTYGKKV